MVNNLITVEKEFDNMKRHMDKVFGGLNFDDNFDFSFKQPTADVYETDSEVVCKFDIPGVNKEDIELSVKNGYVTLRAEKTSKVEDDDKSKKHHTIERNYTGYFRNFSLPHLVDESSTKAKFENGTLTVNIAKSDKELESKKLVQIE